MAGVSGHFGVELCIVLAVYLGILLFATAYATYLRLRREPQGTPTAVEHYLAGRRLGPVSLGFSAATALFSGYTVVGIPAEAYEHGYTAWRWVGSSTFVLIVYLAYAPRLQWFSRCCGYDSVLSFVRGRYGIAQQLKDPLHWLVVLVMLVPCCIFLCAQFDAFGSTISTLSEGRVSPLQGAFGFAALLSLFEMLGGLQAVAITDVVHGAFLLFGSMSVLVFVDTLYGGLPGITQRLQQTDPGHVQVMDAGQVLSWAEFWIGVGAQRALFPDFQQRAMAARSQDSLRMSSAMLAVAPFLVQVPLLLFGIVAKVQHPDLESPNDAFGRVVLDVGGGGVAGRVVGSLLMAASLGAIMSTANSTLIAVSQIVTLDVFRPLADACLRHGTPSGEVSAAVPADTPPSPLRASLPTLAGPSPSVAPPIRQAGCYAACRRWAPAGFLPEERAEQAPQEPSAEPPGKFQVWRASAASVSKTPRVASASRSHSPPAADCQVGQARKGHGSRGCSGWACFGGEGSWTLAVASRLLTMWVAMAMCTPLIRGNVDFGTMLRFQSSILAQLLPTIVFALYWRDLHKWAATSGLVVGVGCGVSLAVAAVPGGVLVSLALNVIVTITVAFACPQFALPTSVAHANALRLVYWRDPTAAATAWTARIEADSKAHQVVPPPNRKEPVNTWWGLSLLAIALPWLALPFYRKSGEIDLYLGGSPLWAVCVLVVLAGVHALLIYIIGRHWQAGKAESKQVAGATAASSAVGDALGFNPDVNASGMLETDAGPEWSAAQDGASAAALRSELSALRREVRELKASSEAGVRGALREEVGALFG